MPDIIDSAARVIIIRRLDIVSAHVRSLRAQSSDAGVGGGFECDHLSIGFWHEATFNSRSGDRAVIDLIITPVVHEGREFGVTVHGIVVGLNAVGIVHCKLWIPFCLHRFVDNAVSNA